MKLAKFCSVLAVTGLAFLMTTGSALALRIAQPPGAARAAQADVIVTGKVTEIEPKEIQLVPFPGDTRKIAFKVAVVKIDEVVKGKIEPKTVRIAFQAPPTPTPQPKGGPKILPIRGPVAQVSLQKDLEGLFYLTKTSEAGVYQATMYYDVVAKNSPTYTKDVNEAKEIGKLLADPMAALKDGQRDKRVQAACMLISAYRAPRIAGQTKEVPIDAEESKLILFALALADFNQGERNGANPQLAFNLLQLSAKDGWNPPQVIRNVQEVTDAMQNWLANNAQTYRIRKIVPAN